MVALQALLSMGFSRQESWSGLLFPFPGDLPDLGIEPTFPESPLLAGGFLTTSAIWEALDALNLFLFHIKCTVLQQNICLLINIYCFKVHLFHLNVNFNFAVTTIQGTKN